MGGKGAKVNSIDQLVDANLKISEFEHKPSQVRQWFTNNIIRPAFAYMVGWTGSKAVMLRVTSAGALKTSASATAIENYQVNDAISGIGYLLITGITTVTITLSEVHSSIDLYSRDNEIYVELDNGNGSFGSKILMRGNLNEVSSHDIVVKRIRFSNVVTDGTSDGKVMCVAWR